MGIVSVTTINISMNEIIKQFMPRVAFDTFMEIRKDKCMMKIAVDINVTHSHVYKVVNNLIKIGLVDKEIIGRKAVLSYTEKGLELYHIFTRILSL